MCRYVLLSAEQGRAFFFLPKSTAELWFFYCAQQHSLTKALFAPFLNVVFFLPFFFYTFLWKVVTSENANQSNSSVLAVELITRNLTEKHGTIYPENWNFTLLTIWSNASFISQIYVWKAEEQNCLINNFAENELATSLHSKVICKLMFLVFCNPAEL